MFVLAGFEPGPLARYNRNSQTALENSPIVFNILILCVKLIIINNKIDFLRKAASRVIARFSPSENCTFSSIKSQPKSIVVTYY